jgi:hypothetical protein
MAFVLTVGSIVTLACVTVVGTGFSRQKTGQTTASKYSGVTLLNAGGLPFVSTIAYFVWVYFFSN